MSGSDRDKQLEEARESLRGAKEENQGLRERVEELVKELKPRRNSMGSEGEEYGSVAEMKEHLKHTRQILIQFIQKLPYS